MSRGAQVLTVAVLAVASLLVAESALTQCVMCMTALGRSAESARIAQHLNSGILFLLAAPFAVAGVILTRIVSLQRGHAARSGEDVTSLPPPADLPSAHAVAPGVEPNRDKGADP